MKPSFPQGIVPHFITCNAFIGRSYAHVLNGFLRDCMRRKDAMALDPTEPLYIVELGTGSGKFSFFMLKALLEMKVGSYHCLSFPCYNMNITINRLSSKTLLLLCCDTRYAILDTQKLPRAQVSRQKLLIYWKGVCFLIGPVQYNSI